MTRQAAELVALQGRVEALEAFARSQASAEEAFATAAEKARDAGFTAGINPRSRELLLDAWAAKAAAARSAAPGAGPEASEEPAPRRRRR